MKVVDKRLIFVNSNERDSGSIDDFIVTIPPQLLTREENQKMRIVLNDLVLPYTWYNVQNSNNTFTLFERSAAAGGTFDKEFDVTLTPGSYHAIQLRDELAKAMTAASSSNGANYKYTVVFDETSARFTFSADNANLQHINFAIEFVDGQTAHKLMGFDAVSAIQSVNSRVTSTRAINLMFTEAIFLHCDLPTKNINKGNGDKSKFTVSSAFAKIPINTSPFNNIIYTNVNDDFVAFIPDKFINAIRFRFHTLDHGRITFNDELSLTIKIEVLEDDEKVLLKQNQGIGELLRTMLLQSHIDKK